MGPCIPACELETCRWSRIGKPYNVDIGDVRQLIALLGEASDVPTEGFSGLLSVVLKVPWVSRVLVCALKVFHEDLLQVHPTLDSVRRKVFQLGSY